MDSEREINEVDDSISMESVLVVKDGIVEELVNSIESKLLKDSPMPASCCIFKVPGKIRRKNVQAYEPDIVSIGPFHSGRRGDSGDKFRLMEKVKHWYLQCLLSPVMTLEDQCLLSPVMTLEGLIKGVMDLDEPARDCYAEPIDLSKKDFVEMMVLDGCFLLELFRKVSIDQQDEDDPVFSVSCMREHLFHDLILLENQLPWIVLERLYNLIAVKNTTWKGNASSLTDLVLNFFRQSQADVRLLNQSVNPSERILHILDLIRTVILSSFEDLGSHQKEEDEGPQQRVPNVTTLSKAGIKLESSGPQVCIMNIKFENGALTIPPLAIDETTGPLFRNLIAFEQCYYRCSHMITSYAVLMDNLIDSSKDIDLLCEKGILANWLSSEDAAQFFNKLYNDTTVDFYYRELCSKVIEHYNSDWNKWMEKLRREHFGTPWAIISLVAAFILLVLTMLQTVYTIQQYYHPSS